jgi:hypothetical protein
MGQATSINGISRPKGLRSRSLWLTNQHAKRANMPASGNAEYPLGMENHDILGDVRLPLE